ncbi:MAG: hypothetical protein ACAI44_34970 [Candidatus Sericytochromatia bacterium]
MATSTCSPSQASWKNGIEDLVKNSCGRCHGPVPDFGAPFPLTDYAELVKGPAGTRKLDRALARLLAGTMPPDNRLSAEDRNRLAQWASCGQQKTEPGHGLQASQPLFQTAASPAPHWQSYDFRATRFHVSVETKDLYQCFYFRVPFNSDRFIRRIEPLIGTSRVIHHILLIRDQGEDLAPRNCRKMSVLDAKDSLILYDWNPGSTPIQFPEHSGFRLRPTDRMVLQIHYNNGAGLKDIYDSSGIRIYHDAPQPKEYAMIWPGLRKLFLPPHQQTQLSTECTVQERFEILAGVPHMHTLGQTLVQEVTRRDGTRQELIRVSGWNFDYQPYYSMPYTLEPGDRLRTSCTWNNSGDRPIRYGASTEDEMCFNFLFVSPPDTHHSFCREINDED